MKRSREARQEEQRRRRQLEEALAKAEHSLVDRLVARASELERALQEGQNARESLRAAVAALAEKARQPDASPWIAHAIDRLSKDLTTDAEVVSGQIVQRSSQQGKRALEEAAAAARRLGALAFPNDNAKAVNAYETAVRLKPEDVSSWIQLGQTYQRAGDLSRAAKSFGKARLSGTCC
jgi:cytochrome c-type biogenesis protein CcmH/NrfG